jgi:hypothetical protein
LSLKFPDFVGCELTLFCDGLGVGCASLYVRTIAPALRGKQAVFADFWMRWSPTTPIKDAVDALADQIRETLSDVGLETIIDDRYLEQSVLSNYTSLAMQIPFAHLFAGLSETQLDEILKSFSLEQCRPHQSLLDVVCRHLSR